MSAHRSQDPLSNKKPEKTAKSFLGQTLAWVDSINRKMNAGDLFTQQ